MGVVVTEQYVCDFCGKAIGDGEALLGRLTLRKAGARGLGRNLDVAFHQSCSEKLTRHASPAKGKPKASTSG